MSNSSFMQTKTTPNEALPKKKLKELSNLFL